MLARFSAVKRGQWGSRGAARGAQEGEQAEEQGVAQGGEQGVARAGAEYEVQKQEKGGDEEKGKESKPVLKR